MKKRTLICLCMLFLMTSFLLTTCAPASVPPYEVVETKIVVEVQKEVLVTKPMEQPSLVFMSWADGDFEVWALNTLVDRFNVMTPYTVNLDVRR